MASSKVFGAYSRALMQAAKASGSASTGGTATKTAASVTSKPKRTLGIQKVVPVSTRLGNFLGTSEASRTDAVKKVWAYIKQHNLQNPDNKKEIFCDEKLKSIFEGKDKVGFTEVAKLLSAHFGKSG